MKKGKNPGTDKVFSQNEAGYLRKMSYIPQLQAIYVNKAIHFFIEGRENPALIIPVDTCMSKAEKQATAALIGKLYFLLPKVDSLLHFIEALLLYEEEKYPEELREMISLLRGR